MLDIAEELHRWVEQGRDFAVATVVAVGGSAPRQPGAALAVDSDGTAIGSVSGGCVEGAVYELCQQALADGKPVLERFGYSDEDAFAVGLTCGGIIDILVTPVRAEDSNREVFALALAAAARGEAAAVARIVSGPTELLGRALLIRSDSSGTRTARTRADSAPTRNWTGRPWTRRVPSWTRAARAPWRSESRALAVEHPSRSSSNHRFRPPG
jgi:xanthine dehydrogenase accessory factor